MNYDEMRALAEAATPGEWSARSYTEETMEDVYKEMASCLSKGGLELHWLWASEAGDLTPCITGNGSTSKANAEFIAAANPQAVRAWLDELDEFHRIRREAKSGDAMFREWSRDELIFSIEDGVNEIINCENERDQLRERVAELEGECCEQAQRTKRQRALAEAWKAAAEVLSIGDCPPLCSQNLGCTVDICKVAQGNELLKAARALETS